MKRTIEAYVKLFDLEDQRFLPLFKMELTFDDEVMAFYPSFQDLEDAILFIITLVSQTLQVWFSLQLLFHMYLRLVNIK